MCSIRPSSSSATGLSRAGAYEFVYAGELLGIALMCSGCAFVGKSPRRSLATPTRKAVPALPARPA